MKKGFTLIELVMVIVILGILAATALPRFINLQTNAQESACKASLGAIRAAVAMQYAANVAADPTNGTYPTLDEVNNGVLVGGVLTSMFQEGRVPTEPYNNSNAVIAGAGAVVVAPAVPGGWQYAAATGRVWLNSDVAARMSW